MGRINYAKSWGFNIFSSVGIKCIERGLKSQSLWIPEACASLNMRRIGRRFYMAWKLKQLWFFSGTNERRKRTQFLLNTQELIVPESAKPWRKFTLSVCAVASQPRHLARRSDRQGAPVLICPVRRPLKDAKLIQNLRSYQHISTRMHMDAWTKWKNR